MAEKFGAISDLKPPKLTVVPGISPDDPMNVVIAGVQAIQTHSLKELSGVMDKATADIAATCVAAEKAATARAEAVITQAGEWAASQIREAGRLTAVQITGQVNRVESLIETVKNWLSVLILVLAVNAFALGLVLWFLPK